MVDLTSPMRNDFVRLDPLTADHKYPLRQLDINDALWRFMPYRAGATHFDAYFDAVLKEVSNGTLVPFAISHANSDRLLGVTAFLNISRHHRRLEVGYTWLEPSSRGGAINPSAKLLLLQRAFDWGALRVEFRADARNQPSINAILKTGAREEGRLRSHTRYLDGTRGDTVLFSIIRDEWPAVRDMLDDRLNKLAPD